MEMYALPFTVPQRVFSKLAFNLNDRAHNRYMKGHTMNSRTWTAQTLKRRRTLAVGQTCNLKVDTGTTRIWLARTGVRDGEPYNNKVTIEKLVDGHWIIVDVYPG